MKKIHEPVLQMPNAEFTAEAQKLEELKKSSNIVDMLTVVLMEAHVGEAFNDADPFGLWYNFARPKAVAIMERFNVTVRD